MRTVLIACAVLTLAFPTPATLLLLYVGLLALFVVQIGHSKKRALHRIRQTRWQRAQSERPDIVEAFRNGTYRSRKF